jgi:hypothetical protein
MKKLIIAFVFALFCSSSYAQNISVDLKDAPVRTTLEMMFKQAGIKNYVNRFIWKDRRGCTLVWWEGYANSSVWIEHQWVFVQVLSIRASHAQKRVVIGTQTTLYSRARSCGLHNILVAHIPIEDSLVRDFTTRKT